MRDGEKALSLPSSQLDLSRAQRFHYFREVGKRSADFLMVRQHFLKIRLKQADHNNILFGGKVRLLREGERRSLTDVVR